jgi:hypothetical protein
VPRYGLVDQSQFVEIADHDVGASAGQGVCLLHPVHADDKAEPATPASSHARPRVFEDNTVGGRHAEAAGRLEEGRGVGLSRQTKAGGIQPIDSHVEEIGDTARFQDASRVTAGSHDRRPRPRRAQRTKERKRRREHVHGSLVEFSHEQLVFAVRKPPRRSRRRRVAPGAEREVNVTRREERDHTVDSRTPVDVTSVVVVGKRKRRPVPARPQVIVEEPFPRPGLHRRRVGHYAIHVEDERVNRADQLAARSECDPDHSPITQPIDARGADRRSTARGMATTARSSPARYGQACPGRPVPLEVPIQSEHIACVVDATAVDVLTHQELDERGAEERTEAFEPRICGTRGRSNVRARVCRGSG